MIFCVFVITLVALVDFQRRARPKAYTKQVDKQTEAGPWNVAVNDFGVWRPA